MVTPIRRQAFTLLELLVVLAILAVLAGLLLAALQRAREAASRASCLNNLKQAGAALHQYHDTYGVLPPGCSYLDGADPLPHVSWMTRILPYLEQESLWRQALAAFAQRRFFQAPPHRPTLGRPQPLFACPSDGRGSRPWDFGNLQVGLASYQGVSGTDRTTSDGLLYLDSRVRLADVRDGASNTLAVGERPPGADGRLGWWYAGWGQAKDGSADLHLGVREQNIILRYAACGPGPFSFTPGSLTNDCDVFHFWSPHRGGANFLFADGSGRFLSYGADAVLPALATRAGGEGVPAPL
jgi:prepilin-type N-terminal cleavage/methylation domain-containing protein/prepilin-type processing-associated H-X9-DG protein